MAEWSIAAVLKTVEPQGSGGSNPSLSAGGMAGDRNFPVAFFVRIGKSIFADTFFKKTMPECLRLPLWQSSQTFSATVSKSNISWRSNSSQ